MTESTQRISLKLTDTNISGIDVGIDFDEKGRSSRVNGMLSRFNRAFDDEGRRLIELFSKDELGHIEYAKSIYGNTDKPWFHIWATKQINEGANDGSECMAYLDANPLINTLLAMPDFQKALVEDALIRMNVEKQSAIQKAIQKKIAAVMRSSK